MINTTEDCDLKIIALNVNSLIKITRRHNLNVFLKENKPDFMLISETKLKHQHKLSIENYEVHRNDRITDLGGGTAILCKNTYKTEQIICDIVTTSFEYTMVRVYLNNNETLHVIAIYKPPSQQINSRELKTIIQKCGHSQFIMGGDFNAKHRSWGNQINETNGIILYEWLNEPNNEDKFTMLTGNEQTCNRTKDSFIDLMIFSASLINKYSSADHNQLQVIPYTSDHGAIVFEFKISALICKKNPPCRFVYNNVKWNTLNKHIENKLIDLKIPQTRNMSTNEIDNLAIDIQEAICDTVEKYIKKIPVNDYAYIEESAQTKSLKHNLKILQRRKARARNPLSSDNIQNSINLLKNMIKNSLENDYRLFWGNKLSNMAVNNDVFGNIRRCSKYGKRDSSSGIMIDCQSRVYSTDKDKVTFLSEKFMKNHLVFNEVNGDLSFFNEVEQKVNPLRNNEYIVNFSETFPARVNVKNNSEIAQCSYRANEIFMSLQKTLNIIKTRNNKKSSGNDCLSNYIIKKLSDNVWDSITIFFNQIINSAHTPAIWKRATIVPIPKNNQRCNDIEQQRPISMINPISKIIEKHMTELVQQFCELNDIIPPHQYGFQRHTSTTHALINFQDAIIRPINTGTTVQGIFLDIEKAFDTVWVEGLIYKMSLFGFDKWMCRYFLNYATNRKFTVKINDQISNLQNIPNGLPQGAVFSPIGWAIYMADIPKFVDEDISTTIIKLSQYADDTAIIAYNHFNDHTKLENDINAYLNDLCEYFKKWRVKLNESKTEKITFLGSYKITKYRDRRLARAIAVKIGEHNIVESKSVKYLGLIVTSNLEYYRHVDHVLRKANTAFAKLKNIFSSKLVDQNVKTLAYKTLIRPIITYASVNYLQTSSYQVERIRRFERKLLRLCFNLSRINRKKYVNSKVLYENIDRIDAYCVKLNIKIIEKIRQNANQKPYSNWKHILSGYELTVNSHHKLPTHLWALDDLNELYDPDGRLLYFNHKKNSNETVYITSQ